MLENLVSTVGSWGIVALTLGLLAAALWLAGRWRRSRNLLRSACLTALLPALVGLWGGHNDLRYGRHVIALLTEGGAASPAQIKLLRDSAEKAARKARILGTATTALLLALAAASSCRKPDAPVLKLRLCRIGAVTVARMRQRGGADDEAQRR